MELLTNTVAKGRTDLGKKKTKNSAVSTSGLRYRRVTRGDVQQVVSAVQIRGRNRDTIVEVATEAIVPKSEEKHF